MPKLSLLIGYLLILVITSITIFMFTKASWAASSTGKALFNQYCNDCHDSRDSRHFAKMSFEKFKNKYNRVSRHEDSVNDKQLKTIHHFLKTKE